ncbi:6,7-dimethyl-8-ribityllumazine synthase [Tepiditoga spiralis]|uniref:6,7-dimethyl-8-ribityllumazine synthase n=1 Tax=Tepiditoga spiralis TaxID=2108365 RepID=A0A7G1G5U9_9BACT|nr:6,7-dimethyl-8-ribityllumazine synthase [Tepiditoga spiralis]BBE31515.1 6,7-dimethyl-8-ribityllumazine synthase [Tepiditoga spiralis]
MNIFEGNYKLSNEKVGIVISRFNSNITTELLEGAKDCLIRHGLNEKNIDVYYVPGSFEVPFLVKQLVKTKKYNGLIALSAVIRGETYHFEVVSNEISKGISQINLTSDIPITFGVITADTVEQALNRAGIKSGNKGFDAAMALVEMMNLNKIIKD